MSSKVKIKWQNPNGDDGKTFIYRSRQAFTETTLPKDPLAIINNPTVLEYEDYDVKEGDSFYYMLAYGENTKRAFSPIKKIDVVYVGNNPYGLNVVVSGGQYTLSWGYDRLIGAGFSVYNEKRPINNGLDTAKVRNIEALTYTGTLDVRRKNHFKVSIEKSGVEYFSNEVLVLSKYPYDLVPRIADEQLSLHWVYDDTLFDSFNFYRDTTPIDENALPAPTVSGLESTSYVDTVNFSQRHYMRVGAVRDGVEYLSNEVSFLGVPHDLVTKFENDVLVSKWKNEQPNFSYFNYYCVNFPMDVENMPAPKATGFKSSSHTDFFSNVKGRKYVRIGIVVDGVEYLSSEFVYGYPMPYDVTANVDAGQLVLNWQYDFTDFEYFNYYCEDSSFSAESLPVPKATGITELSYIDPNIFGRKYVRIGVVRNGVERVSNQLIYGYDRPYAVHSANIQGEFGTRWNFDGLEVDHFNYYRESAPFSENNLPVAKATEIAADERLYIDNAASLFGRQYVRIGAVIAGVEVVSDQFTYNNPYPYDLNTTMVNEQLVSNLSYDPNMGVGLNYYCADSPILADQLPAPTATGITAFPYVDTVTAPQGKKHIRFGVPRAGKVYLSNEVEHRYPRPYNLEIQLGNEQLTSTWDFDHSDVESFNLYYSASAMDTAAMPAPTATGITALTHTDSNVYGSKYVRIGAIRGGTEYFSDEVLYSGYDRPYNLAVQIVEGKFVSTWNFDHSDVESFNYYCEAAPMDTAAMPAAKASGITDLSYTDAVSDTLVGNFIRVGAVRGGVEYLSDEFDTSTIS